MGPLRHSLPFSLRGAPLGHRRRPVKGTSLLQTGSKHTEGSKERYLLGQNTTREFSGQSPLSSYKTTLKQQLNGGKRLKMRWRAKPPICFCLSCFCIQCLEECRHVGMTVRHLHANNLPSNGHKNNTNQPKAGKCPCFMPHFSPFVNSCLSAVL